MHERRFSGEIERLRSPARREMLEVDKATQLCLEGNQMASMLDVGTGSGVFAESFSHQGLQVCGVDVVPHMAGIASTLVPECSFAAAVAEALPFADASFDLVYLGLVWHETDDRFLALREARRVARQQICIQEWYYKEGFAGPALSDRVNPAIAKKMFDLAGIKNVRCILLNQTLVYRLVL